MLLKMILIAMVVLAIIAVETNKLRRVVIYLGIFSLVSSFAYLLYSAPDVAIAEAIIGSTLATILYLVAIKKYSVFTIYYLTGDNSKPTNSQIAKTRNDFLNLIENHCLEKELEPQVIYSPEDIDHIVINHQYDLIVEQFPDSFRVYGNKENYQLDELYKSIVSKSKKKVEFIREEQFDS